MKNVNNMVAQAKATLWETALMKPNPVESESTSAEHAARFFVIEATQCSTI
jgi:hypothetical protein